LKYKGRESDGNEELEKGMKLTWLNEYIMKLSHTWERLSTTTRSK